MRHQNLLQSIFLLLVMAVSPFFATASVVPDEIVKEHIRFSYDELGIGELADPQDPFGSRIMTGESRLGLVLRVKAGDGDWTDIVTRGKIWEASPETGTITYSNAGSVDVVRARETFRTVGDVLDWTIDLESTTELPVLVGDLAVSVPASGPRGKTPIQIFEHGFLNHRFVSGHGSFFFFVRASGAPPFLLVTVKPGTKLEYWTGRGRGGTQVYIHSSLSGGGQARGTWRQEHTALELKPKGKLGSRASYGFRFQFADSYNDLRERIYREGLFDIRVIPGMTVPEDLTVRFSLHTRAAVESIQPEFPQQTSLIRLGQPKPDHHVYQVSFRRLGENMLTILHDGGRKTFMEFFVTEPLETLIKKRASFIVEKQQIRDPSKWWDGVYGPYDMKAKVTRTIEDPDIFLGRMVYVLTCDDPGLCKAPFIAAKNVTFPNRREIESIEYYLENFVWGGLQRTDDERPYPYGVYGTPEWYTNRDPERRKAYTDRNLDKEHVWRSYDYPHIVMLYFHMYQIAKMYPEMSKYLDAAGYLQRAWETARAFYIYPYEIFPTYYETYKWGLYNELVVLELIEALEQEGFSGQAQWLRNEWEKKTKYFVYDDLYPFRSEYAFDRTAFESSYALAKYGATHDMKPDRNLWYDLKLKKWYSHPFVRREHSRAFMERQLAAGLSVRGWLEASFYQLGSDPSMSYMAAMGGWGVLDYALNFAADPWDWLQLGYASYLSSWCLMNTGRRETNYGYWFPGPENDGASGWQFMSAKVGNAWMGSSYPGGVQVPRGPWHYDGEIDLGYGGALRMAATIVTRDPLFGWLAYGGSMTDLGDRLEITPRDGIRRRFSVVLPDMYLPFEDSVRRLKIEVERDGFAAAEYIVMDKKLNRIAFTLENRTADRHTTGIRLSFPPHSQYELRREGEKVELNRTSNWDYPWRADLAMTVGSTFIELVRTDRRRYESQD